MKTQERWARYDNGGKPQTWSIAADGYDVILERDALTLARAL